MSVSLVLGSELPSYVRGTLANPSEYYNVDCSSITPSQFVNLDVIDLSMMGVYRAVVVHESYLSKGEAALENLGEAKFDGALYLSPMRTMCPTASFRSPTHQFSRPTCS